MAETERLLGEDMPHGDLTTEALGIGDQRGRIRFTARSAMVVAAIEESAAMLECAGVDVTAYARSGDVVESGARLLDGAGDVRGLLGAWKVAQTLVEVWSGVATATHKLVAAARAVRPDIVVACTRKNVPGTKALSTAAIKAGGAVAHRLGLSETILVFPEHRAFMRPLDWPATVRQLRAQAPEKKLVVEVNSVVEACAAAEAGFDVIQAEKFPPGALAQVVAALSSRMPRPVIVAAGGINLDNAGVYAQAGPDLLVTSWPYTARPAEVAVEIVPVI